MFRPSQRLETKRFKFRGFSMRRVDRDPRESTVYFDTDDWTVSLTISEWNHRKERMEMQYVDFYEEEIDMLEEEIAKFRKLNNARKLKMEERKKKKEGMNQDELAKQNWTELKEDLNIDE